MIKIKHTGVAAETLRICKTGGYVSPLTKQARYIAPQVEAAVRGTVLYRPNWIWYGDREGLPRIVIEAKGTAQAAQRYAMISPPGAGVALLNFASAKQPGGGFLSGASAQEEDLCRCSALYPCLLSQLEFYEQNRAYGSAMYTDHIIYSPDVPFFRDEDGRLIDTPFTASVITAPAPNAGAITDNESYDLRSVLSMRAKQILAVAAAHEHKTLILGAWGCGAFKNDPRMVADVFEKALADYRFGFDLVVFAILDTTEKKDTLKAFEDAFR